MAEVGRGVVPEPIRKRKTKGEFSRETLRGYRTHRAAIQEIFKESALADTGYIDGDRLYSSLGSPDPDLEILKRVEYFIGCEMWYRNALAIA